MSSLIYDVFETITDGGLGILPGSTDGFSVLCGVCSLGTANQLYSFTDPTTLKATLGEGPLVEAAAYHLGQSGKAVICVPIGADVDATLSSVTKQGTSPSMTVAGSGTVVGGAAAPLDSFECYVWITGGGARGVATFKYSLDAGQTYSPNFTVPSGGTFTVNYLKISPTISTGIVLTFPAGTYVAGDYYSFTTTAPGFDSTAATAAWNALVADPRTWEFFHLVGAASTASASATMATAMEALNASAEANHRFVWNATEIANDTDNNIISAFASVSARHSMAAGGYCYLTSNVNGSIYKRPIAWPVLARISKIPISQAASEIGLGSLPGVVTLNALPTIAGTVSTAPSGTLNTGGFRDEEVTPALDAARIATLRTLVGQPGFFNTQPNILAAPGSDYKWAQYVRIANKTATVARAALLPFLNARLAPDPTTGFIKETDARKIERRVNGLLTQAIVTPGDAVSITFSISRTDNLLSAQTLNTRVRIVPDAYAATINLDIGFRNPALTA